jgi:hypothetical protein
LENNTLNPNVPVNTLVKLTNIIIGAHNYLAIILDNLSNLILGNSLNYLALERLNTFYTKLNPVIINQLLNLLANFVPQYKQLTFNESTIILRPIITNQTRKATSTAICNELGQLNPLINSLRGIPSQMRKLTRKVNLEAIQKNIKMRINAKETQKAKEEEEAKQQTWTKIEAAEKTIEAKNSKRILERIDELSREIAALVEPDLNATRAVKQAYLRILGRTKGELANLKRELTAESDKESRAKKTKETADRISKLTSEITALKNIADNTDSATKQRNLKEIAAKQEEIARLEKESQGKKSKGGNRTRKTIYLSKTKQTKTKTNQKQTKNKLKKV